jgi:hypothetical protein
MNPVHYAAGSTDAACSSGPTGYPGFGAPGFTGSGWGPGFAAGFNPSFPGTYAPAIGGASVGFGAAMPYGQGMGFGGGMPFGPGMGFGGGMGVGPGTPFGQGPGFGQSVAFGPGFGYGNPGFGGFGQSMPFGNVGFANPMALGWGLGGLRRWGGTYSPQFQLTGLPTDDEITEMIYDAIDDDPLVPFDAAVNVDSDAGVVTLTGTVATKQIKHAIGDDAWWIPGVDDVRNDLQVEARHAHRPSSEGETGAPRSRTARDGERATGANRR